MSRPSAGAALFAAAMIAASPLVARAAAHDNPPLPPELAGLEARDIPGTSARPDRVWTATLHVLRTNGIHVPADATWGWLPWDTHVGGVAVVSTNTVLVDPMAGAADGRYLALVMAHEAAHLASHHAHTRRIPVLDPLEEAAAEAIARDLYPVIRKRLRLDPLPTSGAYQQQVSWLRRATTTACAATHGGTRHQVERCARHTRRWFLMADDTTRQTFATRWATGRAPGVRYPTPNPARPRTIVQQLIVERARWAAERRTYRQRIRALAYRPDAYVAFQLAGLAYGVDWRHLRACALSEGYREAERYQALNARPNTTGSGATGAFQFMRGTYLGTPHGRAGLNWHRVDVQAHAAAWMWSVGRIGEWTGKGC